MLISNLTLNRILEVPQRGHTEEIPRKATGWLSGLEAMDGRSGTRETEYGGSQIRREEREGSSESAGAVRRVWHSRTATWTCRCRTYRCSGTIW